MCSVTGKPCQMLHSWLIEYSFQDNSWDLHCGICMGNGIILPDVNGQDPLWDNPWGLHNRISERRGIILSDMNGHISSTSPYLNQSPVDEILFFNYTYLINPNNSTQHQTLFIEHKQLWENSYLWRMANMSWSMRFVVKQIQPNPISSYVRTLLVKDG